jgi:hypothetical protein
MKSRPFGSMIIWLVQDNKWTIKQSALFPYYQNAVDYLSQFAQTHDWKLMDERPDRVSYGTGPYRIEVTLMEASKGLDLNKETYLFEEISHEETSKQDG